MRHSCIHDRGGKPQTKRSIAEPACYSGNQLRVNKVIMNRSKVIAILTGAIAIALSLAYLLIVQLLDFRGEMVPAPIGILMGLIGG